MYVMLLFITLLFEIGPTHGQKCVLFVCLPCASLIQKSALKSNPFVSLNRKCIYHTVIWTLVSLIRFLTFYKDNIL